MAKRILIIQHADKVRAPGDPELTKLGISQAAAVADHLADHKPFAALWTSPMRRAVQTAEPIAAALGLNMATDHRLVERMNWSDSDQPFTEFLQDWKAATDDRHHQPRSGDSSTVAGRRFLEACDDLAHLLDSGDQAVIVTHGGVTTDALRTMIGDERLDSLAPTMIQQGPPNGAISTIELDGNRWNALLIASTTHLTGASPHRPG